MNLLRPSLFVLVGICFSANHLSLLAQESPITWRFTTETPSDDWASVNFDDSQWSENAAGFGTRETPGTKVNTVWNTKEIWLRTSIEFQQVPKNLALLIHHDEDAEVQINGTHIASFEGYTSEYELVALNEEQRNAVVAGKNTVAVHCRQTRGGQYIDVLLVDATKIPKGYIYSPFDSELITRWGREVTPQNAWDVYPRPAMVRNNWQNLNGLWNYAVTQSDEPPSKWDGEIVVPFALESKLSGVERLLQPDEALWYQRTFEVQRKPRHRVRLNFEAVDYESTVWVNGVEVGQHTGGNNPFSFDITRALKEGANELIVRVEDATGGAQLRGKQKLKSGGIWYTRVSGIWQTVWLEQLPREHITRLQISTDPSSGTISVVPKVAGGHADEERVVLVFQDGTPEIVRAGDGLVARFDQPRLWSPGSPHLYHFSVVLRDSDGEKIDQVESYAGIRSVGKVRDADGHLRLTLNGEPIFHFGPLDQGWWPDGLLTPPSEDAMRSDIEYLKAAGFNMIRKHIKVEPRLYYYHCDRIGMMLWQDHVSGGEDPPWTRLKQDPQDATWTDEDHQQFMVELRTMVRNLENHPSIVMWVPFNEAWGQHRTVQVGRWMVKRDPSRLVNVASGGNFWPVGDVVDHHAYPHPEFPFNHERYADFVKVVGEFGGHGYPVEGHLWDPARGNWGYGGLPKNAAEYRERYAESLRRLNELRKQGIAAGVYTQTTDVEVEINGLMTYDREVVKIDAKDLAQMHQVLYE